MKTRYNIRAVMILVTAFMTVNPLTLSGQKGTETGTPYGSGEDSLRCIHNTILYLNFYTNNDYPRALDCLRPVLEECPASSENIYLYGESIYTYMYNTTGNTSYIDSVMMILTQRTAYFNNKQANDLRKASILSELGGDNAGYAGQCFNLISAVADSLPEYIDHNNAVLLMRSAARSFAMNLVDTAQVVTAYSRAAEIIESRLSDNPEDENYVTALKRIDSIFSASGAMTCRAIETLYSRKVKENLNDVSLRNKVFTILTQKNCTTSDLYFRISAKMYAEKKTSANAIRLAEMFLARKDRDNALFYFTEAFKLDTNRIVKSDVLTRVAGMEFASGKKQEARNRCEYAYELNNKNGKALMLIAEIYASTKLGDAFENHSVYWVAVDYLNSAKKADPSLTEDADKKIRAYSKLFPTASECFFKKITDEGIVYRVGGWINEVTIVRFRKE